MSELFGGVGSTKPIPKHQIKKLVKKLKKSYEIGDKLKKIGEIQQEIESNQADVLLEQQLINLDK